MKNISFAAFLAVSLAFLPAVVPGVLFAEGEAPAVDDMLKLVGDITSNVEFTAPRALTPNITAADGTVPIREEALDAVFFDQPPPDELDRQLAEDKQQLDQDYLESAKAKSAAVLADSMFGIMVQAAKDVIHINSSIKKKVLAPTMKSLDRAGQNILNSGEQQDNEQGPGMQIDPSFLDKKK